MVNIFDFTDYRAYLKAYFEARKKSDPKFSHRWLARRLDLSTSNLLWLVMQGKRNLTGTLCHKITEVFRLSRREAEYFENTVGFMQAKTNKEKDRYFSRMAIMRKKLKVDRIEERQYEYYTNWYHPVVRELVAGPLFNGDYEALSRMLQPSITPSQAKRSVELLLKLGMIKRQGGRYVQTSPLVTTGPEVNSLAVVNFHRAMGGLAVEALDRFPKNERNITSSTIFINAELYETIRKRIEDLRNELLSLAGSVEQGERVYQANFQLFPVSRTTPNPSSVRRGA
jgi:uncharacterized protein (TIGR02147 family)